MTETINISDLFKDKEVILVEETNGEFPWEFHWYKLKVSSYSNSKVYVEKGEEIKE